MPRIELLAKNVYNQIAAGEVVEKPASIIKELVENSIDAKAKNISIDIHNGGISYISITDDGVGINPEDVELAFMPHATSKIRKFEDLSTISSMGFRGEALASISAVSRVEMTTKTAENELGIKIVLEGGEVVSKTEVATVTGTRIVVKDLFFNTPARAKFLRKPKTEEGDITTYVEKLMLSNTDINFRYSIDDKVKYNTTNCGLIDTIYTIYGREVAQNVLEVDYRSGDFHIYGYISKPVIAKNNRTYQSLFVNKRYCLNSTIAASISKSCEEFLMKGKFPLYVLSLTMPQNSLDVNVHPNKLEVKFENPNQIFMIFSDAISQVLYSDSHIRETYEPELSFNKVEPLQTISKDEGISFSENTIAKEETENKNVIFNHINPNSVKEESNLFDPMKDTLKEFVFNNVAPEVVEISTTKVPDQVSISQVAAEAEISSKDAYESLFRPSRKVIGVAFNTYIIVEQGDRLFFIDQHAAHERQLFDKFNKQISENDVISQDLMVPYILNVSESESNFLEDNLELINEYGFEMTEFGKNCFKITAVPLLLSEINIESYFDDLLSNLNSIAKKPVEMIRNDIATMACKAAVKGGNILSEKEIDILLNTLEKEETTLLCPHGRPIVVVYDKKQLEKLFKRIV